MMEGGYNWICLWNKGEKQGVSESHRHVDLWFSNAQAMHAKCVSSFGYRIWNANVSFHLDIEFVMPNVFLHLDIEFVMNMSLHLDIEVGMNVFLHLDIHIHMPNVLQFIWI